MPSGDFEFYWVFGRALISIYGQYLIQVDAYEATIHCGWQHAAREALEQFSEKTVAGEDSRVGIQAGLMSWRKCAQQIVAQGNCVRVRALAVA